MSGDWWVISWRLSYSLCGLLIAGRTSGSSNKKERVNSGGGGGRDRKESENSASGGHNKAAKRGNARGTK